MSLQQDLQLIMHGEVSCDDTARNAASRDTSLFQVQPSAVVHPMNVQDICALVRYASKTPHTSLTARSAGTDMTGGPLNEGIIIDMTRHFGRLGEVKGSSISTEPGVYYRDLEQKTLKHNLLLPSYPASKEICTVGGMVNNNSGGEKTLLYGKTDRYIEKLSVVLADGNEYELYPLTKKELEHAMQEKTFLGKVYRDMYELLEKNYDAIQSAKPHVSKNSAGYALWNVWDKKTFDLTKLFAGSQGTLGVTTHIQFRLVHPKKHAAMLVLFLQSLEPLAELTNHILKYQPESFESYDDHTLLIALRLFSSFVRTLKTNAFTLALQFLPETMMMLRGGLPKLIIMAEFTGDSAKEVITRAKAAQSATKKFNILSRIATTKQEQDKYWTIRRESFNLLRKHVQGKHTAPFIDDCIVEPKYLPEFLPKLAAILDKYDLDYTIAGHVGDGNFHIIPLMDLTDKKQVAIIPKASREVYNLVFSFHGSSTAEHNDGLVRSHLLPQMYGPEIYSLFEQTKKIFDPKNIFNPGKKVNSDWKYSLKHITAY
ncbi:MAG TPA: FAD-binding oxidoreductase [Candidatus Andersenbacteria bacterium]|nr:FAD-binding oxidoreductase [Candidatus Andersenbacteria bacterium]